MITDLRDRHRERKHFARAAFVRTTGVSVIPSTLQRLHGFGYNGIVRIHLSTWLVLKLEGSVHSVPRDVTLPSLDSVQYLLLENVAPLWTDLAWRSTLIQELMKAGFHLIFAENIQVRATVPVDRTRFIAVAIESDVQANWTPSKRFEILRAFGAHARWAKKVVPLHPPMPAGSGFLVR